MSYRVPNSGFHSELLDAALPEMELKNDDIIARNVGK